MKRVWSLLAVAAMLISMLACIVLPTAMAAETAPVKSYAEQLVNLYTKSKDREAVIDQTNGGAGALKANDKFYSTDAVAVTFCIKYCVFHFFFDTIIKHSEALGI